MASWDEARWAAELIAERKKSTALKARVKELEGAARADEERLIAAAKKAGITFVGCDTPDTLADELLTAKARVAELEIQLRDEKQKRAIVEGILNAEQREARG